MYKYLFETLLSVLLGIYPEVELLVLLRSSAVLLLPEQLTRELLAKVEPVQMPWCVWFSVKGLYQLQPATLWASVFSSIEWRPQPEGQASPPATRLQGLPEIMVLQQPGLWREAEHR